MPEPSVRVRRKIRVLAEDLFGGHILLQLNKVAILADKRHKGIEPFHRIELLLRDVTLAKWRHAEINEFSEGPTATAAASQQIYHCTLFILPGRTLLARRPG